MSRIASLSSTLPDMMVLLADGNPGAITAMVEIVKAAEATDPDSMLGAFGPVLSLDSHGIYGSEIWILFKEICGQSSVKMLAVLRAIQLGIASESEIKHGIAAYRLGADRAANEARVEALLNAVKERLPKFAAGTQEADT